MSFPIRNFASPRALLAGLFLACGIALPAAAASSFDVALADQSDFLQRPGGRAVTDESDSSSPIPLPGTLPRAVPRMSPDNAPAPAASSNHEEDVIDFLKSLSGDEAGREVLAIIVDLLDTGYVHLNAGKDDEVYVWPYFYAMPLDRLTPPQIVELFEIVTAGDFEDMKKAGGYIFYSIGIGPDGSWRFFTAGE